MVLAFHRGFIDWPKCGVIQLHICMHAPIVCSIVGYYEEMSEKFASSSSLFSGPLLVGTPGVTFHGETVSPFSLLLMSVLMLLCIKHFVFKHCILRES